VRAGGRRHPLRWTIAVNDGAPPRLVWFHRDYRGLTGGQVKHAHYFEHVARMPGFARRIAFTGDAESATHAPERARLWPASAAERVTDWRPGENDVLFVAGVDWRYLARHGLDGLANPRINLVQHVRHAHPGSELHGFLANRAVRICVSAEVADAINATGRVNGPVLTIPNGTDCEFDPSNATPEAFDARPEPVVIIGYKRPEFAAELSRELAGSGIPHRLETGFLARDDFLDLLKATRVAVCLPRDEEGFYLPALEAMAAGCTVVTLDCVGNRGFCRHEDNCLVAEGEAASLARTVRTAADQPPAVRQRLVGAAADTVRAHSLAAERRRFHDILGDIDALWRDGAATGEQHGRSYRPKVDFMIVGAQKSGTTALAHFLAQHPQIGMLDGEGHVFDSETYSRDWTPERIDERYANRFAHCAGASVFGESTPVYMYLEDVPAELARYNPDLKLVVALRDPVERAISQYDMERQRRKERLPLPLALLVEPFRLRRSGNPHASESAARRHSYRSRSLYSVQLKNLLRVFPPGNVLVIRSEDLLERHGAVLERVFRFLGVPADVNVPPEVVFKGERDSRRHGLSRLILRLSLLLESVRLRTMLARFDAPRPSLPEKQ